MSKAYDQRKLCLVEGLEDFATQGFQCKDYTDLTIRCQDREFFVHKLIVCLYSIFFKNACKPDSPFKEAKTGIIELHEDDLLIHYPDRPVVEAERLRDARLYAIAEKYQAPHTKDDAATFFHEGLDPELKLSITSFINIAKLVFESTPDSDRTLRNLVFRYAHKNLARLMSFSRFESAMGHIDGFWSGLARFSTFYATKIRMCPCCGKLQQNQYLDFIASGGRMQMTCENYHCRSSIHSVDKWNTPYDELPNELAVKAESDGEPSRKRPRLGDDDANDDDASDDEEMQPF
ncbi:hypothetical protein IWZ00DRAFT_548070 [Phyllosticta capitalensis]